MSRRIFTTLAVLVAAAPLIGAPMVDRLPSGTLVYVGWAGRSLVFDGSAMGQFLAEPGVDKMLGAVKQAVTAGAGGGDTAIIEDAWQMASLAWQHPTCLALTDIAAGEHGPMPSACLLIDLGADREAFDQHLQAGLAKGGADEGNEIRQETVGAVTYSVLTMEGLPGKPEVSYGYLGSVFFAAVGPGEAKKIIEMTPDASLAANPTFADCWQQVGGADEQAALYIALPELLARVESLAGPAPIAQMVNALGLGKATALACSARVVDHGIYTKARLLSPGPHQGLLMLLAGTPLDEAALAGVPGDSDVFLAASVSPAAVLAEIKQSIGRFSPEAQQSFESGLAGVDENLGFSLENDLLAALGDRVILSSAESQGGFGTGTVLSISVRDEQKLSETLSKLETALASQAPVTVQTVKAGRTEVHYASLRAGGPIPVAPAWAVYQGELHVALWPQVICDVIARDAGSASPVTATPAYQAVRQHLGASASMISYTDTPRILRKLYGLLLVGWTTGSNLLAGHGAVKIDPDWLPPLTTLEKYLWPSISSVSPDERGITFEGYGSMPACGLLRLPMVPPMAAAILLPSLNRARSQAKAVVSMTNLRGLGMAIMLYQEDYDGKYPGSLRDLFPLYVEHPELFVSPTSGHKPPDVVDGKLVGQIDYVYLKPSPNAPPDTVMAYEREGARFGGKINVLMVDTSVHKMSESELAAALAKQKSQAAPASEDF
jgi:hypothetical protein